MFIGERSWKESKNSRLAWHFHENVGEREQHGVQHLDQTLLSPVAGGWHYRAFQRSIALSIISLARAPCQTSVSPPDPTTAYRDFWRPRNSSGRELLLSNAFANFLGENSPSCSLPRQPFTRSCHDGWLDFGTRISIEGKWVFVFFKFEEGFEEQSRPSDRGVRDPDDWRRKLTEIGRLEFHRSPEIGRLELPRSSEISRLKLSQSSTIGRLELPQSPDIDRLELPQSLEIEWNRKEKGRYFHESGR